jgi:hypothetical protein
MTHGWSNCRWQEMLTSLAFLKMARGTMLDDAPWSWGVRRVQTVLI